MPTVANFVCIQDANITIPSADTLGLNDLHIQFVLPGLSKGPAVLFFRFKPSGSSTLQVRINKSVVVKTKVVTGPSRSFHEALLSTQLKASANEITVSVSGNGNVTVSDIVLFYQVKV